MAVLDRLLQPRNDTTSFDSLLSTSNSTSNATQALISSLVFAESKSIRTSTIILASFNALAAFAIAASILYDSNKISKLKGPKLKTRGWYYVEVHSAYVFPLVQSSAIFIQSCVFAGAQGTGLKALVEPGCQTTSQIVEPAIFLVIYVQVVFGLECAIRSFRRTQFQERGRYDAWICIFTVFLMEVGTWVLTRVRPSYQRCYASLVWFTVTYAEANFIILAVAILLLIMSVLTIFIRLAISSKVPEEQRIAASGMVYYLILSVVSAAFVIPYYVQLVLGAEALKTEMIATVVLNLSGLMAGLLQIFLRTNTSTSAHKSQKTLGWSTQKNEIRLWGRNGFGSDSQRLQLSATSFSPLSIDARLSPLKIEKRQSLSVDLAISPPLFNFPQVAAEDVQLSVTAEISAEPNPVAASVAKPTAVVRPRKQSYSLFPADNSPLNPSKAVLLPTSSSAVDHAEQQSRVIPITDQTFLESSSSVEQAKEIYLPELEQLEPPRPLFISRHRRDNSAGTTATVQIGLRLTYSPDDKDHSTEAQRNDKESAGGPSGATESPPGDDADCMKTLPPTPRSSTDLSRESDGLGYYTMTNNESIRETKMQLTPAVYSPNKSSSSKAKAEGDSVSPGTPRQKTSGSPAIESSRRRWDERKTDWI